MTIRYNELGGKKFQLIGQSSQFPSTSRCAGGDKRPRMTVPRRLHPSLGN
jgi:hypothetical protein